MKLARYRCVFCRAVTEGPPERGITAPRDGVGSPLLGGCVSIEKMDDQLADNESEPLPRVADEAVGWGSPAINSISAVTLATHDMARAIRFYRCLGFSLRYGGEDSAFTSFSVGSSYLNLIGQPKDRQWSWWGRIVLYVSDVDAIYEIALANGLDPESTPRDAEWGERYFHLTDPDGHQLSLAKPLASPS